jgi:hypothetical protein
MKAMSYLYATFLVSITLLLSLVLVVFIYLHEWVLFIWNKIRILIKNKKSYDKVFHSISKVQKRERQR